MLQLLSFFEDPTTADPATPSPWLTWGMLGLLLVALVLMTIIPQRKQKKQAEEMMSRLRIGSTVTTIGGIVGEVIAMDDTHIWISTGKDNKSTLQFLRQAIHSVAPEKGEPVQQSNDDGEIK